MFLAAWFLVMLLLCCVVGPALWLLEQALQVRRRMRDRRTLAREMRALHVTRGVSD